MMGQGGLAINNPDKKYRLKNLDGEFTALHLVTYMYVGMSIVMPGQDAGSNCQRSSRLMTQHSLNR